MKKLEFDDLDIESPEFGTLDQCTQYYLDEIGKIDKSALYDKEKKALHKYMMSRLHKGLKTMKRLDDTQHAVVNTQIDSTHQKLRNYQKELKSSENVSKNHQKDDKKLKFSKKSEEIEMLDGQMVIESPKEEKNEKERN
ncbi:MAG: hypothetical protein IKC49_03125 [Clostridia bacterium]|nr:hypothetical protein [Clostridia bacterium]